MSEEINENEHEEELRGQEEQSDMLHEQTDPVETITKVTGMYKEWFLDYASYVILERAVPSLEDGLKPVQRRIMHSMKDLDDGRYNKVANIVGHTMQYHPHGDASIADAMVQIGQKELLIDMQGNWGNILTGDRAAASRYIEARLSKFALDVVFNPKTTAWKQSYDGRRKEPIDLPVKFPLLLAQGAEGIVPISYSDGFCTCFISQWVEADIDVKPLPLHGTSMSREDINVWNQHIPIDFIIRTGQTFN